MFTDDQIPANFVGSPEHDRSFSAGEALSSGWRAVFNEGYGLLLGMIVVQWIISIVAGAVLSAIPVVGFVAPLLLFPLNVGIIRGLVLTLRGEPLRFETLFAGFYRFLPLVGCAGVGLLIAIAAFLPVLLLTPLFYLMGKAALIVVLPAAVAMLLGLLYVQVRLSLVPLLILDRPAEAPFLETLKDGWRMTEVAVWQLILLQILLFLFTIVCVVLFLLPVFFVAIPLAAASLAAAYEMLRPRTESPVAIGVDRTRCLYCGYSFEGLGAEVCPECGAPCN